MTVCDVPRQSRAELCVEAGVGAFVAVADFLGVPHRPPEDDAEITLPPLRFDDALRELAENGVPLRDDPDAAWREFRQIRARYEPLIAVLGRMTDAPRSESSSMVGQHPAA